MNCFHHISEPAVAQCVDCHKGLCIHCASKYNIPICDDCNNHRKRRELVQYIKPLIICAVLFAIGYNIDLTGQNFTMNGYMVMCIYVGWKTIDQFIPNLFVWFSIKAIVWYYLIRVAVSMFIGIFAAPVYLIYCIIMIIIRLTR